VGSIVISRFGGIAPKVGKTELATEIAQSAQNAKLYSKELRAFRSPLTLTSLSKAGILQSLYWYVGATWLHWTQDVNVARNTQAGDALNKIIFTGTDKPRVTSSDIYLGGIVGTNRPPDSYILGLPAPITTPVATDSTVAGNLTGTFNYVYTYVRKWSDLTVDEGPPSPIGTSPAVAAKQIDVATSNAGAPTFADYGITHKRIYRLNTGTAGAAFQFVTEHAVATVTFRDNVATTALGAVITSTSYFAPPDTAIGVIALPNGVYAMFSGNTVYLSDPYHFHAYPTENQWPVPATIVGMGAYDTTLVLATDGYPFTLECMNPSAVAERRLSDQQACTSKRGVVSAPFGVLFPSNDGMVVVGPAGYQLVTRDIVGRDEWAAFKPATIHACFLEGRYLAFYQTGTNPDGSFAGGGFVLDRAEGSAALSPLNYYAYATHVRPGEDQLYVVSKDNVLNNKVSQWEGETNGYLQYSWRSKQFIMKALDQMAYASIEADYAQGISPADLAAIVAQNAITAAQNAALLAGDANDTFNSDNLNEYPLNGDNLVFQALQDVTLPVAQVLLRVYANGVLIYENTVSSSAPVALPSGASSSPPAVSVTTKWEIELGGQIPVQKVKLASGIDELAEL
jgi:hypothetical protein